MRIACPDCSATYDVPAERLAPGRKVRCARCGRAWSPSPADAPGAAAATVPPGIPAEFYASPGFPPSPAPQPRAMLEAGAQEVPPSPPATRHAPAGLAASEALAAPIRPEARLAVAAHERRVPRQRGEAARPAGPGVAILGWLLTLLILGGGGYAAYLYRPSIESAWPPSGRLYAMFGLP